MALLLILVTGLRGGEVVSLKREHIKCVKGNYYIEIHYTETRYKKMVSMYMRLKMLPKRMLVSET